jgi:hypothetical protein
LGDDLRAAGRVASGESDLDSMGILILRVLVPLGIILEVQGDHDIVIDSRMLRFQVCQ